VATTEDAPTTYHLRTVLWVGPIPIPIPIPIPAHPTAWISERRRATSYAWILEHAGTQNVTNQCKIGPAEEAKEHPSGAY